jgi:hypothetical protein
MSVDGTFEITAKTPIGNQIRKVTFKTDGNSLSAISEAPNGTVTEFTGTVNGNELEWTEEVQSPMGKMKMSAKATVDGDKITGQGKTLIAKITLNGVRV